MDIRFYTHKTSNKQIIPKTIYNAPVLPKSNTVNFSGKIDKTINLIKENKKISNPSLVELFKYYKVYITERFVKFFTSKISKQKANRLCQTLFIRPDLSVEDSLRILDEYKELDKIKNLNMYTKSAFDMIKKNYGFSQDSNIQLKYSRMRAAGAWDPFTGKVYLNVYMKRKDILAILHHELRHALQSFIAFSEKPDEYIRGLIVKVKNLGSDEELDKLCIEHCGKRFDTLMKTKKGQGKLEAAILKLSKTYYGNTPIKDFQGKEEFVNKIIDAEKIYVPAKYSKIKYYLNPLEIDAFKTERRILKLLKSKITD